MADVILKNLSKSYGTQSVLSGLDLHIEDGEFVVLVGPSGCGKSTTLQMVAGLEEVSGGNIIIGGKDVTHLPPKERNIAMVFQSYALFPHMTVSQNVSFGPNLRGESKSETASRIKEISKMLKLGDYLDRLPKELSGGQRQRVALARALVRRPGVFLMDEPLSNLDAKLRIEARSFLSKMHQELGITTIYVTHDQSEAMTMGSRIIVMKDGFIEQAADPLTVYNEPQTQFVAGFIGSPAMNCMQVEVKDKQITDSKGALKLDLPETLKWLPNGPLVLGLRPEHISIQAEAAEKAPFEAVFNVDVVQHLGHETLLDLTAGQHRIITRSGANESAKVGEQRRFSFDLSNAHFYHHESGKRLQ